jgi:hypothetical protein
MIIQHGCIRSGFRYVKRCCIERSLSGTTGSFVGKNKNIAIRVSLVMSACLWRFYNHCDVHFIRIQRTVEQKFNIISTEKIKSHVLYSSHDSRAFGFQNFNVVRVARFDQCSIMPTVEQMRQTIISYVNRHISVTVTLSGINTKNQTHSLLSPQRIANIINIWVEMPCVDEVLLHLSNRLIGKCTVENNRRLARPLHESCPTIIFFRINGIVHHQSHRD